MKPSVLLFAFSLFLCGCGSTAAEPLHGAESAASGNAATPPAGTRNSNTDEEEEWDDADHRKVYMESYLKPVVLDTAVTVDGKLYRMLLRHACSFDSAIKVPAKYNWDTKEDFITHNFYSTLTLLDGTDTAFSRTIDRIAFDSFIQPEWKPFANLSDPGWELTQDSIVLRYSIGIPVTDLAEAISIRFDTKGNYQVFK